MNSPSVARSTNHWWILSCTISVVLLMASIKTAMLDTSADYQQGEMFKFLYIHVPSAWFSLLLLLTTALLQMARSQYKQRWIRHALQSSVSVGLLCALIVMATGYFWGTRIWGGVVFSDPRTVSQIIVVVLYIVYLLYFAIGFEGRAAIFVSLLLGVMSLCAVVLNHFSVYWYSSIHQLPSVIRPDGNITIDQSMRSPLWLSTLFLVSLVLTVLIGTYRFRIRIDALLGAGKSQLSN